MKKVEIDMASLSTAQKALCAQLLAHSNPKTSPNQPHVVAQVSIEPSSQPQPKQERSQRKKVAPSGSNGHRKPLARTVRVGELNKLAQIHPEVEVYVYPKRMSEFALSELVESCFQRFWKEHKKKSSQIRSISFAEWVHRNVIGNGRDRLKGEQLLVSLIDSLNHHMPRQSGLRLFYNFLAETWPTDALFYLLVVRGILEQVLGQKMVQKVNSGAGSYGCGTWRLRHNPYERCVSEEEVVSFLGVLMEGGLSCSRNRSKSYDQLYEGLTGRMFYDEDKKRNMVMFYELLEYMLVEFMEDDVSNCSMSLSNTTSQLQESTPQIDHRQEHTLNSLLSQPHNMPSQPLQTDYYLTLDPVDQQRIAEQQQHPYPPPSPAKLISQALQQKAEQMYSQLYAIMSARTENALSAVSQAVAHQDKNAWVRFRGEIGGSELSAIERLQELAKQQISTPGLINRIVKGILLLPAIRECITEDIAL